MFAGRYDGVPSEESNYVNGRLAMAQSTAVATAAAATTPGMAVRQADERISVIGVTGDITAASEAPLLDAYERANGGQTRTIILNLSGMQYLNSSGIGLLVTLLVRANRQRQRLLACGLGAHYREIFRLTRLDEAIDVFESEPEALTAAEAA